MTVAPVPAAPAIILTAEQRQAVEHPLRPLRIIAGAGSGKTTVMVERIAHLVATGATPDQILGLTFTNKAAAELKQRVDARLGVEADVTVTTYHSLGSGLVSEHGLELDLHPRTRLLHRAEAWQLLFGVFDEFRFDHKRVFRPGTVVNDALTLASRCADHLVDIADVEADARELESSARWQVTRDAARGRAELCQIVCAYDRRKRERHLVDFDDQIRLAVKLLSGRPELCRQLADQYPYVLLDEYQDTNYAQRILLQLIYPAGSVITAVGDDMQSIYAFRGAHKRNLLDFSQHFPSAGGRALGARVETACAAAKPNRGDDIAGPGTAAQLDSERALTENWRSGPAIVELANRIQGQVSESVPKQLVARPGAPRAVIECFLAADDAVEAAVIAADIKSLGEPWSAHAVLCRKRRLIPAIAAALEAAAVPVDVVGASGLLDRPEVVDLVAWLELLAEPGSAVALLRILRGPRYRLGWRDLAAVARHVRASRGTDGVPGRLAFTLVDALRDPGAVTDLSPLARSRLGQFNAEHEAAARAAKLLPVLDLAESIANRTGLWAAVDERGQDNLLRFLDLAEDFAPVDGVPGLSAFVDYLHLLDDSEEDLAEAHIGDREAVALLTIHQAKGLEWDHVWVPGLAGSGRSRIFPDDRSGANPLSQQTAVPWWLYPEDPGYGDWRTVASKDIIDSAVRLTARDEEWRLLYVACTRARHRLVCSAAQWYPGPTSPQGPSDFYQFVAGQTDLVAERFRHQPSEVDPRVTQMRARRLAIRQPPHKRPVPPVRQGTLFDDRAAPPVSSGAMSVTGIVSYRRCPRQYYWLAVRPLPRRGSAAAQIGTAVHRWIEQRSRGQRGLLEPDAEPDAERDAEQDAERDAEQDAEPAQADPADRSGGPGATGLAGLKAAFLASPYARLEPRRVEAPFVLAVAGRLVRGRIDAVYEREGRIDLVDFKTGAPPSDGDPGGRAQLDLYAVAAIDLWHEDPSSLRTTYCYLDRDGSYRLDETDWTADRLAAVRAQLAGALARLAAGEWAATPGGWCRRCEWREVCKVGRIFLSGEG